MATGTALGHEPADRPTTDADTDAAGAAYRRPLAIVTSLFFMWGGITALNDILIPHLKSIFELSYAHAMFVQFAFFSGYFLFAVPAGRLIAWVGYKAAMVAGLGVMAAGTLTFLPAAAVPSYPVFLTALLVLAAGMTVLQVAANPYVSVLGPPRTASSRLNLTQAFNSLGTTLFPYLGAVLILGSAAVLAPEQVARLSAAALHAYRVRQASSVRVPYLILTAALVVLAALIGVARLPVLPALQSAPSGGAGGRSIWSHRPLVLGAVGIFLYVGAEVAIGSFLINYLSANVSAGGIVGLPEARAAKYVSLYWGGAMVGRFIGSAVLQRVSAPKLLGAFAVVALCLVAVSMATSGPLAMCAILAVGLFNSIMFPNIFALSIEGLGERTSRASSILIAAIVGGAIVPVLQGIIADHIGVHHAFVLPLACYAYIAFFAVDRWRDRGRAA